MIYHLESVTLRASGSITECVVSVSTELRYDLTCATFLRAWNGGSMYFIASAGISRAVPMIILIVPLELYSVSEGGFLKLLSDQVRN